MARFLLAPLLFAALAGCEAGGATAAEPAGNAAAAAAAFPALTGRVVDEADLVSPEVEEALADRLERLEQRTTDQFVIVTVPELEGRDIADYSRALGNHWGIGREDRDNGVLLVVAPNERRVRIAVGKGLERTLSDARALQIIEERLVPAFREGDYEGGIIGGAEAVIETLEAEASQAEAA